MSHIRRVARQHCLLLLLLAMSWSWVRQARRKAAGTVCSLLQKVYPAHAINIHFPPGYGGPRETVNWSFLKMSQPFKIIESVDLVSDST